MVSWWGRGIYFGRFNFDCNSVNAMQSLFRVDSHYRKGGAHSYNMMKTGDYLISVMESNIDTRIC